jgi:hypothetical protein
MHLLQPVKAGPTRRRSSHALQSSLRLLVVDAAPAVPRDTCSWNDFLTDYFSVYVSPALNWKEFFLLPNAGSFKKSSKAERLKLSRL